MAQRHKAATEVLIARTEEQSAFQGFVDRYWKLGLLAFLAIAGFVMFRSYKQEQKTEAVASNWSTLAADLNLGTGFSTDVTATSAAAMAARAQEFAGQPIGGLAKALEARAHLDADEPDKAVQALKELKAGWPDHIAATLQVPLGEGKTGDLLATAEERSNMLAKWRADNSQLFGNPPLPEGSPRVKIKTSRGDLVVGLFQDRAPNHVENFLKLCREGYYDQTRFHRVMANFMVQGGDPNSKSEDTSTWGQGGPEEKIAPEFSDLFHFEHVLAAAKMPGDTDSSGSQFYITTAPAHHLDGQHTVYGVLLEGESVLEDIESSPLVEGTDRPIDAPTISGTEIL